MKKIKRSSRPALFLSKKEQQHVQEMVAHAESETSGEIRVHIAGKVKGDILKEAAMVFERLGMTNTKLRNGVLIFFAVKNRSFAIIGDQGIHLKMGDNLWGEIAAAMQKYFQEDDFAGGLAYGIDQIGHVLKTHFPHQKDDVNELPDEISFEK